MFGTSERLPYFNRLLKQLGDGYEVIYIDTELCIYKNLGNGFGVEFSGVNLEHRYDDQFGDLWLWYDGNKSLGNGNDHDYQIVLCFQHIPMHYKAFLEVINGPIREYTEALLANGYNTANKFAGFSGDGRLRDGLYYKLMGKHVEDVIHDMFVGKSHYIPRKKNDRAKLPSGQVVSFRDYMLAKHIDRDDPVGDLAREIENDPAFPDDVSSSKQDIKEYLDYRSNGWDKVIDAFEASWKKYAAYRRRVQKIVSVVC